jgi:hypothetical protein
LQNETGTSPAILCVLGSCRKKKAAADTSAATADAAAVAATDAVSVRLLRTHVPAASQQHYNNASRWRNTEQKFSASLPGDAMTHPKRSKTTITYII